MTVTTALWPFALVVGLLTPTPGLDTALVLRTAALGHRARAWGVVLGIQTGVLARGALTSLIAGARLLSTGLRRPTARRTLDRLTGTVITAFGLRPAFGD